MVDELKEVSSSLNKLVISSSSGGESGWLGYEDAPIRKWSIPYKAGVKQKIAIMLSKQRVNAYLQREEKEDEDNNEHKTVATDVICVK